MHKIKNDVGLSRFNNSWYHPGSKLKILFWYFTNRILFKSSIPFPIGLKLVVLRLYGAKIDQGVIIKPGVSIKYPWKLTIGASSWIGEQVWIDNLDTVGIGANVCISQGALLLSGNHDYKSPTFDLILKPIILEDGVWIGAKSIVCQGVTCKSHSVLAVGSVANKDLEAYKIYKGNPAVYIRERVLTD